MLTLTHVGMLRNLRVLYNELRSNQQPAYAQVRDAMRFPPRAARTDAG